MRLAILTRSLPCPLTSPVDHKPRGEAMAVPGAMALVLRPRAALVLGPAHCANVLEAAAPSRSGAAPVRRVSVEVHAEPEAHAVGADLAPLLGLVVRRRVLGLAGGELLQLCLRLREGHQRLLLRSLLYSGLLGFALAARGREGGDGCGKRVHPGRCRWLGLGHGALRGASLAARGEGGHGQREGIYSGRRLRLRPVRSRSGRGRGLCIRNCPRSGVRSGCRRLWHRLPRLVATPPLGCGLVLQLVLQTAEELVKILGHVSQRLEQKLAALLQPRARPGTSCRTHENRCEVQCDKPHNFSAIHERGSSEHLKALADEAAEEPLCRRRSASATRQAPCLRGKAIYELAQQSQRGVVLSLPAGSRALPLSLLGPLPELKCPVMKLQAALLQPRLLGQRHGLLFLLPCLFLLLGLLGKGLEEVVSSASRHQARNLLGILGL
mmetsp:Transcript_14533/g.41631  ORF Transcript_14533/g.41631 Transcript_14533/m.41631 type:complete len:438 (+) Transcript_14533:94-1407(+)